MRTSRISAEQIYAAGIQANAMRAADNSMLGGQMACANQQVATAQQAALAQRGYDGLRVNDNQGRAINITAREHEAAIDAATPTGMTPKARDWAGQAAEKRIAELEALVAQREKEWREQFEFSMRENTRACRVADDAGALRTELQTVKAELCDALRENERLKRKAGAK